MSHNESTPEEGALRRHQKDSLTTEYKAPVVEVRSTHTRTVPVRIPTVSPVFFGLATRE